MTVFRVPYPKEPERRRALFEKGMAQLSRFGACEGTPDEGAFHGQTPIGSFAGRYSSPPGSDAVEIEIVKKPWLVSMGMIEREARKFMVQA